MWLLLNYVDKKYGSIESYLDLIRIDKYKRKQIRSLLIDNGDNE